MEKRLSYFVSRKNGLTWLMALLLAGSAVTRIVIFGEKGVEDSQFLWSQILLPTAACLIYVLITLLDGKERFYRTAIPVWMISIYFYFAITNYDFGRMVNGLFAICLLFFALVYSWISAGRTRWVIFLLPLFFAPLCTSLYLNKGALLAGNYLGCLPNALMLLGLMIVTFAIHVHPSGEYHPTWGDRTDGRRIRTIPPMAHVSPYIMETRNTSTNSFADALDNSAAERYVRKKRRESVGF